MGRQAMHRACQSHNTAKARFRRVVPNGYDDVRRHEMTFIIIFGRIRSALRRDRSGFSHGTRYASSKGCAFGFAHNFRRGRIAMSVIEEFNQIREGAKQQRAEIIGSTLQAHALPVAIVVALSFALLQFASEPAASPPLEGTTSPIAAQLG
jgi:hypothetical protein